MRPFLLLFFFLSCIACANIGTLTGGAKDVTPPKIVEKKSTPNLQTNFKKQDITLTFDEWVKLEDVFTQVVVSPPLNEQPEVTLKGKSVVFRFADSEKLRENATYTINFGNAVKDNNEGNVVPNLRFVFSTGAQIDSLEVTAKLIDAITGEPAEETLFMLYDNLSDSVVRTQKPFYFGKTDKIGFVKIQNVRAGTFKAFALKDSDLNYRFNQDAEKIGFPDQNIVVDEQNKPKASPTVDSTKGKNGIDSVQLRLDSIAASASDLIVKMFDPEKPLKVMSRETDKFGVAKIIFNQEVRDLPLQVDSTGYKTRIEWVKDTALVWYSGSDERPFNLYLTLDKRVDTIRVRPRGRADFLKNGAIAPLSMPAFLTKHPTKPIVLSFNNPIQNIDSQRITLKDSLGNQTTFTYLRLDSLSSRKLRFDAAWQSGGTYQLEILPNAITDIFGFKNTDTLQSKITVQPIKEFGDVILNISGLDTAKSYVCQLIGGANNVEGTFFIQKKSIFRQKIATLQPDEYRVKVVEDVNGNGKWDTGNYDEKRQPERIFLKSATQKLRPNWELEIEVDISRI